MRKIAFVLLSGFVAAFAFDTIDKGEEKRFEKSPAEYYEKGIRELKIHKDFAKAVKYLRIACDYNITNGCFYLGTLYEAGKGVEESDELAEKYLKKACLYGNVRACSQLDYLLNSD